MKTKILEVLNKRDGKYEDGIYYMLADEIALNELAEELNDLFALRSVVRSDKVCSHKGDYVMRSYLEFMEFIKNETANGRFQKQCPDCQKYYFPSEY